MTPAQLNLLGFIRDEIANKGIAPSYVEIMEHLGRTSRGSVHSMVARLVRDGHLVKDPLRPRGLRLPAVDLTNVPTELLRAELRRRHPDKRVGRDELTPRRRQVLDFVMASIAANGRAPTDRELASELRSSVDGVHSILGILCRAGYLRREPDAPGGYALPDGDAVDG